MSTVLYDTLEANEIQIPPLAEMGEPGATFVPAIRISERKRLHSSLEKSTQREQPTYARSGWRPRHRPIQEQNQPQERLQVSEFANWLQQFNEPRRTRPRTSSPIRVHTEEIEIPIILNANISNEEPSDTSLLSQEAERVAHELNIIPLFRAPQPDDNREFHVHDENAQMPPLADGEAHNSRDSGFDEPDSSLISQ